jgi:hypothetical protein
VTDLRELMKDMAEAAKNFGELKGELKAVKEENERLRGLLSEKRTPEKAPLFTYLSMKCDVSAPGSPDLIDVLRDASRIAKHLGITVEFEFNSREIRVRPSDDVHEIWGIFMGATTR